MAIKQARLIYGATYFAESANTDLLWMVKMSLPDPHVFLEFEDADGYWERILLANSLEFTRAKKQARNCSVLNTEPYFKQFGNRNISLVVKALLERRGLSAVTAHPLTPFEFVEKLRESGIAVSVGKRPWYESRIVKNQEEIGHILEVQVHMENVLRMVEGRLRRATITDGIVMEDGKPLTSEELRSFVELELYKRGCVSLDTIISSGVDAAMPHKLGSGPIRAHTGIVCDIFPYSKKTGYFSDMTRTFCKGEPTPLFVKMYNAVLRAQEMCINMVRSGVDGKDIQEAAENIFADEGFKTSSEEGFGFIHGVGHGLGLLCHEPPAGIQRGYSFIMTKGVVTSVEPGLYYPKDKLGVRIEDLVVVTKNGCMNLTLYPKRLGNIIIP